MILLKRDLLLKSCFRNAFLLHNVVPGNYFKILAKEQPEIYDIIINNYNAVNNYCYDYLTLLSTHSHFMCFPPCRLISLIMVFLFSCT